MAVHTAEQLAHEQRRYLQVFAWLAVLTALEIGIIYAPIPHAAIVGMLILLAGTKAAMVALYYMHLTAEKSTLMYIALTPAILCVWLLFMLMPDLGGITRALTHTTPPPPAAAHH